MAAKKGKSSGKKVKSLPAKSVTAAQAKRVKGGLNPQPLPPRHMPKY
jgi:hypothetical protein